MSHKKFGPDRFSRFDVYWIQTNRQTDKHPNKQAKFIYRLEGIRFVWSTGNEPMNTSLDTNPVTESVLNFSERERALHTGHPKPIES